MSKKQTKPSLNKKLRLFAIPLGVVLFAVVGALYILLADAAPKAQTNTVTIFVDPSSQRVKVGDTVPVKVRLNTAGKSINAVQANLTYPQDKFDFGSLDGVGSDFEIDAQSNGANGTVKIARGSIKGINNSNAYVATVNLVAKQSGSKVKLQFSSDTVALTTENSTNALQRMTGGSFTIQQ